MAGAYCSVDHTRVSYCWVISIKIFEFFKKYTATKASFVMQALIKEIASKYKISQAIV